MTARGPQGALPGTGHFLFPPPESFNIKTHSLDIGKFRISPFCNPLADGQFRASVSIRSGHGSSTHDRVLRLLPHFNTELAATQFALREGLAWLAGRGLPLGTPTGLCAGLAIDLPVDLPIDLPLGSVALAPTHSHSVSVSPRSGVGAVTSATTLRPVLPAERARPIRHRRGTARTTITLRADRQQPA